MGKGFNSPGGVLENTFGRYCVLHKDVLMLERFEKFNFVVPIMAHKNIDYS